MIWRRQATWRRGDQRLVRLSLFRNGSHSGFEVGFALGVGVHAVDCVAPAIGRQANCKRDVVGECSPGLAHATSGKIEFHISERTKKMISSRMIGEMSMPPRFGSTRRIGRSSGSVTL